MADEPKAEEQKPNPMVERLRKLLADAEAGLISNLFYVALGHCEDPDCVINHSEQWFYLDFDAEHAADERLLGAIALAQQRLLGAVAARELKNALHRANALHAVEQAQQEAAGATKQ